MPANAADRKSVRAAEKAARLAARERADVIRNLMSTTAGRKFLWDLLGDCHIFATTFNLNALVMAHAEGERNVGLRLLADVLATCPDQYILAQREANVRYNSDDRSPDDTDTGTDTTAERLSGPEPDGRDSGREGPAEDGDNADPDLSDYDLSRFVPANKDRRV